jgi:hypothetical protein
MYSSKILKLLKEKKNLTKQGFSTRNGLTSINELELEIISVYLSIHKNLMNRVLHSIKWFGKLKLDLEIIAPKLKLLRKI